MVMTLLLMGSVCATDIDANNTETMSASDDEVVSFETVPNLLATNESTFSELSEEIGSGGDIELKYDYYTYDQGSTIYITTDNTVIKGNGAIIDMAGSNISTLNVSASGVTIKDLTFKNANFDGDGGAIYFGGLGTVENCTFVNNSGFYGGAIYFSGNGTVENCNFINNLANRGSIFSNEECNLSNCNFVNNIATADGGAIFIATGNVENCNFTNNSATSGGAVDIYDYGGIITNCTFVNNVAWDSTGALLFTFIQQKGQAVVTNCSFVNNTAKSDAGAVFFKMNGEVTNCYFVNNTCEFTCGAINFNSDGEVTNCSFVNNTAVTSYGAFLIRGDANVTNCSFVNNTCKEEGGAFYVIGNCEVTNCNFTNNAAKNFGGAIVIECYGKLVNCNFVNSTSGTYGGALLTFEKVEITNCSFVNNTANNGGALLTFEKVEITNCSFVNNAADSYGGAAWFYGYDAIVENCSFVNCTSGIDAGGIYISYYGEVKNCNFTNNQATGNASWGGAILVGANCNVTNCNFISNFGGIGGAVFFYEEGNLINSNFTNNSGIYGGAAYIDEGGFVTNCNFIGNNATKGSAIYFKNDATSITISNSLFLNNRANADANSSLQIVQNGTKIEITFMAQNNLLNAIYSNGEVNLTNVTYWGANGIANTGSSSTTPSRSNREAGQNITVVMIVNDIVVLNTTEVTDDNGTIVLDVVVGNSTITACHVADSYYTEANATETFSISGNETSLNLSAVERDVNATITPEIATGNVTFVVENESGIVKTVETALNDGVAELNLNDLIGGEYVITATYGGDINYSPSINNISIIIKNYVPINLSDIAIDFGEAADVVVGVPETINGQNITISVNGTSKNATADGGEAKVTFADLPAGEYLITADYPGDDYNSANFTAANLTVNKLKTELSASEVTTIYNVSKELEITLKDSNGNPLGGADISVDLNGDKTYTTDNNGQVNVSTEGLTPNIYTAKIIFNGDANHDGSAKDVNVTVNKVPAEIILTNETFDLKVCDVVGDLAYLDSADAANLIYTSSNREVVFVSSDGFIAAIGNGTATVTVSFNGNDLYEAAENKTISVTVIKELLSTIVVDGKEYPIEYVNGTATVTTEPVAKERLGTIITAEDFTQYSCDYTVGERGGYFVGLLTDSNGIPLVNKTVQIGYNGLNFNRTTNETGHFAVQIGLQNAGLYTFGMAYLDDKDYNASFLVRGITIVKKPTSIVAKNKVFKAKTKTKKLTVKLKTIVGSAIDGKVYLKAGKKLTLKINGKKYTAKTNAKGKATFKITKLTKKAKYVAKISFAGDTFVYKKSSKKIFITVK